MVRMTALACLGVVLVLGTPGAGAADAPQLPPGLDRLLSRPDHRVALLQAAEAVEAVQTRPCPHATYVTTGQVEVLQPLKLNAHGQPVAGAWKESVNVTGCDTDRVMNALTTVMPNGVLKTRPLLPGTTIAGPQLQADSVEYAAAAMGDMPAGCEQGGIVDTAYARMDGEPDGAKPPPGAVMKPWTELWTLQACSKRAVVIMHFTPDGTGTEIQAALADTPGEQTPPPLSSSASR
jgi:hypothetical protein